MSNNQAMQQAEASIQRAAAVTIMVAVFWLGLPLVIHTHAPGAPLASTFGHLLALIAYNGGYWLCLAGFAVGVPFATVGLGLWRRHRLARRAGIFLYAAYIVVCILAPMIGLPVLMSYMPSGDAAGAFVVLVLFPAMVAAGILIACSVVITLFMVRILRKPQIVARFSLSQRKVAWADVAVLTILCLGYLWLGWWLSAWQSVLHKITEHNGTWRWTEDSSIQLKLGSLSSKHLEEDVPSLRHVRCELEVHLFCTDADLALVKGLTRLRVLHLEGTKVTDVGLEHLKGLTQLQSLHLNSSHLPNAKITDAGLEHLKGLTQLRQLNVYGTAITDTGAKSLEKSLPNLQISGIKHR
jgi:hypothetical protein